MSGDWQVRNRGEMNFFILPGSRDGAAVAVTKVAVAGLPETVTSVQAPSFCKGAYKGQQGLSSTGVWASDNAAVSLLLLHCGRSWFPALTELWGNLFFFCPSSPSSTLATGACIKLSLIGGEKFLFFP